MKTYSKAKVISKNLPTGSYSAGCPADSHPGGYQPTACKRCERTM